MAEPQMDKQSERAPRRRGAIWLLLALLALIAAAALLILGTLHQQNLLARNDAADRLAATLAQSRVLAADYVRTREQQRADTARRLARQAETVCSDVQVFLQAAVIRREAEINARLLEQVKQKRDRLAELVRQQAATMKKLSAELSPENSAAITTIQPVPPGTTAAPATPADPAAPGAIAPVSTPADPAELLRELQKAQEENLRLSEQLSKDAPATNSKAKPAGDDHWPEKLLRECGADLESILPENCAFSAAEAGGRLLLALGGGKASADEVRAEASRTLLLQAQGRNFQWVVRVVLADPDAPARANPRELAAVLTERLALADAPPPAITGWILNDKGVAEAGFPTERANDLPSENARPGVWFPASGGMGFLQQGVAVAPAVWPLALQVILPERPLATRLEQFGKAHPLYAGGLLIVMVLLLGGLIVLTVLARRGGGVRFVAVAGGAAEGTTTGTGVRPVLGSLERLQRANRGRHGEGSRILDLARSGVLRELAARIRQSAKDTKTSSRAPAPALREYRK